MKEFEISRAFLRGNQVGEKRRKNSKPCKYRSQGCSNVAFPLV